jgi:nanoRNase/pAp phosphatase (c-di-AMP/oligoRNAs hydrolase)
MLLLKESWETSTAWQEMEEVTGKIGLQEFMEKHRGQNHLIILADYPKPDAVAAAFAHRFLSSTCDIDVSILYNGRIRPRQNVALVKLLGIDFLHFEPGIDLSRFDGAILLAERETISGAVLKTVQDAGIPFLLALLDDDFKARYRLDFNAGDKYSPISAYYAVQLENGMVKLDRSRKDHVAAATALLYGIMSASDNFIRAKEADFRAASFLSSYRDPELLEHIMSQHRSKHTMGLIQRSLAERVNVESYSIAGIGYVRSEDQEAIAQAAEFLLTEDNVHTAIVYGILKNDQGEALTGSMRSTKLTIYPEEFLLEVFGGMVDECRDGVADLKSDDFRVPIGFLAGELSESYLNLKWQVYDLQVKHRIFEKIGVKHEVELRGLETSE